MYTEMKKQEIEVVMVDNDGHITRTYTQTITGFVYFGRELKITPKANACVNKEGHKLEFFVPTISVSIGIGKDHTADLVMTEEAWKEFYYNNAEISIDTVKEFSDKYIRRRRVNKKDNKSIKD